MTARMRITAILIAVLAVTGLLRAPAIAAPQTQPAATASPAAAPTPTPVPKSLGGVVVTAQRHPTPPEGTSRQVWTISGVELERLGAMTAADALRFIPGTVVQQYGTYGSLATAALRGASSSQTLVLINGEPANEPDTGVFDFSSLPVSAIDHIEIVQGGSSTLYGSAAMGGVINIFTKTPVSAGNVNLYLQWGYRGEFTRGLGLTAGAPDLLARMDVQTVSANNQFAYPAYYGDAYPAGVRTNDDTKTEDSTLNLNSHIGIVRATALLQNDASIIGAPGSVLFASGQARQDRIYQRASFDFDMPLPRSDVELQVGSDGRRLHFYDTTEPFPYDTQGNANSRQLSLRATTQVGSSNVLTAGYDGRNDTALFDFAFTGVPYGGPPVTCQGITQSRPCVARDSNSAMYVEDEEHAVNSPFSITAGVRNEHTAGTKSVSVPSAGAIYQLSDAVDVVANYGRAFRNPNLDELYYPSYGDPSLQPEYGATFDAGFRGRGSHSDFNVAYFGSDTNNLIINVPIDAFGDVKPFNVSRARIRGIESSIDHDLWRNAHASLSYTNYLRAVDETPEPQFSGHRLLYRPTATASATLWIAHNTWTYALDSVFVGRRYADEANTQVMRPYVTTGVHVKKRVSNRFAITLAVSNLENNSNAEDVFGYPVIGRAFSLRLSNR
jgi:vitamin B12 transporter